jgi:hypothetical protein
MLNVDVADAQGNYRNFLNLQAIVVSPKGDRQTVHIEQTGPGHYEARFPTKEIGSYLLNIMELKDGKVRASQSVGASINYSPEFTASEPNHSLLTRLAESGGGKVFYPDEIKDGGPDKNPFLHDRKKTSQPRDLWENLLQFAILLFIVDVGVRRIQLDRDEMRRALVKARRWLFFWEGVPRAPEADESLNALLARRDAVRSQQTAPAEPSATLFQPTNAPSEPLPGMGDSSDETAEPLRPTPEPVSKPAEPAGQPAAANTTSRLLEAKRRAQQRRGE